MNLIGYWIQDLRDEQYCAPQELSAIALAPDVRERVSVYLDAGVMCESFAGHSWCRFFCGIPDKQMGSEEFTDGQWIWPAGLSHYVREHGVALPQEFIADVLNADNDRRLSGRPQPSWNWFARAERMVKGFPDPLEVNTQFWVQWCRKHRSQSFLEQLRLSRDDADRRARETDRRRKLQWEQQVAAESLATGLSEHLCVYAGCKERALQAKAICARHLVPIPGPSIEDYRLRSDVMVHLCR